MLGGFYTHEDAIDNPYSTALDKTYRTIAYFAPSLGFGVRFRHGDGDGHDR
jgi:hypothetical protein